MECAAFVQPARPRGRPRRSPPTPPRPSLSPPSGGPPTHPRYTRHRVGTGGRNNTDTGNDRHALHLPPTHAPTPDLYRSLSNRASTTRLSWRLSARTPGSGGRHGLRDSLSPEDKDGKFTNLAPPGIWVMPLWLVAVGRVPAPRVRARWASRDRLIPCTSILEQVVYTHSHSATTQEQWTTRRTARLRDRPRGPSS